MADTSDAIAAAVRVLREGGVVGMPTETVYGLAADARDPSAVARVFALKGRPSTNPLIVHVATAEVAERYALVDDRARRLFAALAPGPLTVVLPLRNKSRGVPPRNPGRHDPALMDARIASSVTAGLDTVGIRIPNHPLALALLRAFDGPLAAPSANVSNHISPTTAQHVRDEFGDAVLVLDGGPCAVGVESAVLDLASTTPRILRPGVVTRGQIEAIVGPVEAFAGHVSPTVAATSPGQQEKHYAPRSPAFRFSPGDAMPRFEGRAYAIVLERLPDGWRRAAFAEVSSLGGVREAAQSLYATLRDADASRPDAIYVELPPDRAEWVAVRDRIVRATRALPE